jgi:hypothetical protein
MKTDESLQTEFNFVLPKGLVDETGKIHSHGTMRLATGKDEIYVDKDPRVRKDPVYGVFVILSRVITNLGELESVTPEILENLFTRDLAYLREFYNRINQTLSAEISVKCPRCSHDFSTELTLAGK